MVLNRFIFRRRTLRRRQAWNGEKDYQSFSSGEQHASIGESHHSHGHEATGPLAGEHGDRSDDRLSSSTEVAELDLSQVGTDHRDSLKPSEPQCDFAAWSNSDLFAHLPISGTVTPDIKMSNDPRCQATSALLKFQEDDNLDQEGSRPEGDDLEQSDREKWSDLDRFIEAQDAIGSSTFTDWIENGGVSSGKTFDDVVNEKLAKKRPFQKRELLAASERNECGMCHGLDIRTVLNTKPKFFGDYVMDICHPTSCTCKATHCKFCQFVTSLRYTLPKEHQSEDLALFAFSQSRYLYPTTARGVILAVLPEAHGSIAAQQASENLISTGSFLCTADQKKGNPESGPLRTIVIERDRIDYTKLRQWTYHCKEKHGKTCSSPTNKFFYPTSFIDCNNNVIVCPSLVPQYVALSYVWGKVQSGEESTPGNSSSSSFPTTIRDAIKVTLALGYRFLWVDRYCISQNSVDKMKQIQQMDLIYQNAEVVILAAYGEGPEAGLPGVRPGGDGPLRVSQPQFDAGSYTLVSTLRHPEQIINSSVWSTRGWTHQEALLAQRRLIFTEEQVYFDCWGMHRREAIDFEFTAKDHIFNPKPGKRSPGAGGNAILSTIAAFTRRELTHQSDAINAFTGILKAYARADPPVYSYWGVPILPTTYPRPGDPPMTLTQGFLSGLCWESDDRGERRPGFPSWSWAGWTGAVSSSSHEYIVGVKLASRKDISISVDYKGSRVPWEDMWKDTWDMKTIRQDLPQSLLIEAWTTRIRFLPSSYFNSSRKREGKVEVDPGYYAHPETVPDSHRDRIHNDQHRITFTKDPLASPDLLKALYEDSFLAIFLGRRDRWVQTFFVLVVQPAADGRGYERVGTIHFPFGWQALTEGWFLVAEKEVIELV